MSVTSRRKQNTWVHWRCTVCGAAGWDLETYYACDMLATLRQAHTHPEGITVGERKVLLVGERP